MSSESARPKFEISGSEEALTDIEKYLENGVHIGTKHKTGDMDPYVYRARADGLFVLDVRLADEAHSLSRQFNMLAMIQRTFTQFR